MYDPASDDPEEVWRRQQEARSPATPRTRLRQLAQDPAYADRQVVKALAANPSTPPDVLPRLLDFAPGAFCRNPMAPLLSLENPDFVARLSAWGIGALLRSRRAPWALVAQVARWGRAAGSGGIDPREEWAETARMHRTWSDEHAGGDWVAQVRRYWEGFAYRRTTEQDTHALLELIELGCLPANFASAADRPDPLPDLRYERLRSRATEAELRAMTHGAGCTPARLRDSYSHSNPHWVHEFLGAAIQPGVPEEILWRWAQVDARVAAVVAQNPTAAPGLLEKLARHEHPAVRRMALRHPGAATTLRNCSRTWLLRRSLRKHFSELHLNWQRKLVPDFGTLDALVRFPAMLEPADSLRRSAWSTFAYSPLWQDRLAAAVSFGPRQNGLPPRPKHQAIMRQRGEDGNRLVQAAALGRLGGENFTW